MLNRIQELERADKLQSLINVKTRNWNITKLSPDNFLCTYENDKDGDEQTNNVKSIHIVTKPDELGYISVKTDDLAPRDGSFSEYVKSSYASDVSTFVQHSLESLAESSDSNILELRDHFSNRFSCRYFYERFSLMMAVMNADVNEVKLLLDDIATEGESFLQHAIFTTGSILDKNGQYVWKSLSPLLYAAWSGDIRLVKLMLEYIPDYYQREAATELARLIEVGTDRGPLMQPYLDLADKCKQLAALLKWNATMPFEKRLAAVKSVGAAQSELPLFGIFLLCDPDFYRSGYKSLEDKKRNCRLNGECISTDDLGSSSIIYVKRYHNNKPVLVFDSLKFGDTFDETSVCNIPMWDGEPALFTAEALKRYYKNVKLELSNLILSCIKKYNPNGIRPLDNLAGFSSEIPGRGIRLFYPKHAFEDNQVHHQDECVSYSPGM